MRSAKIRLPSITWVMPDRTMSAGLAPTRLLPSKVMEPLVMAPSWAPSRPVTARAVVLLPAPLAPSSATIEPSGTSMDSPRNDRITLL